MKTKTYRVIEEFATYSKKKGAVDKRIILAKGLSLDEAIEFVKVNKSIILTKDNLKTRTKGLLYPGSIEIK